MSTLVYLDSFDHYDTAHVERKWTIAGMAPMAIVPGRNGYGALPPPIGSWKTFIVTYPILTCGLAYKTQGFANGPIGFRNTLSGPWGGHWIELCHVGDGRLYVRSAIGNSPAAAVVLNKNQWYYLEFQSRLTGATDTSMTYVVRVNEATVLSGTLSKTGYPTYIQGWATVTTASSGGGFQSIIDDMYVTDDEFLGDIVIGVIRPNGVGLEEAWAPSDPSKRNWELTKEHSPDDDATYVDASYIGLMDRYDMDDVTLPFGGVIKGIQGLVAVKKTDEGSCIVRPEYECLGGAWSGTYFYPSETSYIYARDAYRKNPISGLDFTVDEINSIRFGHKRTG